MTAEVTNTRTVSPTLQHEINGIKPELQLRMHHYFEASCDATPDATALEWEGGKATYAQLDASANRLEFGISDYRATLNPAPAFHPGAGLRTVGLGAAVSYDWSPEWRTTLYYKYDRLVGDAAQSPIVRLYGSANQMTFGLGIHYSFRTTIFD